MLKVYKKSFTLIELMVTIILSLILFNFLFSFQFNFIKELENLKAREKLAMNSYKLMEIATKGLKYNGSNIPGMISANVVPLSGNTFEDHNNKMWTFDRSGDFLKFDNYIYRHLNLNSNLALAKIKDKDNNYNKLYSLKFDSEIVPKYNNLDTPTPRYTQYTRLVYSK